MGQTNRTADELTDLTIRIFTAAGWSRQEAEDLAEHLVLANLSGHDSHGVGMIPAYIQAWQDGLLSPRNRPEVRRDGAPFLVIDAKIALGQPAAKAAVGRAIAMAGQSGVCLLNLINANHMGRIGHYAEMAAAAGMIGLFWVNVAGRPSVVASFGARESRFGTNPHAIGIPNGAEPLILDFATSRMAHGKARVAFNKGERVPEGYLIDEQGKPTTDPAVVQGARSGALLPFGDHKGAGIAIVVEILAAALAQGAIIPETPVKSWIINNLFGLIFDPARLDPNGTERERRIALLAAGGAIEAVDAVL
ncbi:MAG TPA: Ldh family oxidoreductase, partial [Beijerinckiaceae bacterium]|nr:Ldh family oxidoreductase [Beijerinckiaceae bacterium]